MLCLPGFTPVAKLDQAVGDSEGWVEARTVNVPVSARCFRLGSLPSSIHFLARVGSIPSKPITKTRCRVRRRALPGRPPEQSSRGTARARARAARWTSPERRIGSTSIEQVDAKILSDRVPRPVGAAAPDTINGRGGSTLKRTGSVLCPSCGTLVGVNDAECLTCGRRNPGLWGFTAVLRNLGDDMGFVNLVLWACGALY